MCQFCELLDKDLMLSETFHIEFIKRMEDSKYKLSFTVGSYCLKMNIEDKNINYCFNCGNKLKEEVRYE